MKRKFLFHFLMTFLFLITFLSAVFAAEKYPTREIQLVIPMAPGGALDVTARLITGNLGKDLGVPIIVNNRAGAAAATGTYYLVKSKPDGYTIGYLASTHFVLSPATTPDLPFKYSDLDPLCKYCSGNSIVFCKGDAPWKTLEDLVADARKRPGQITYGATTNSFSYFVMEGFLRAAGITMLHVPVESAGQAVIRVLGGNLDVGLSSPPPLLGHVKAGNARILIFMGQERSRTIPQIPILREKGYPDPILNFYMGFFVPLGVPEPIRETLKKALEKTIKDPTLPKRLEDVGYDLEYLASEALRKEIEEDYKRITQFVKTYMPQK